MFYMTLNLLDHPKAIILLYSAPSKGNIKKFPTAGVVFYDYQQKGRIK